MTAQDYFAIQNLLNLYFQYVDAADFERCGQLFAQADLTYTQSGKTFSNDPAGVTAQMQSFVKLYGPEQTPKTRHHSGNIIIEAEGDTGAHSTCTAVIYQATEALPFQAIGSAHYEDQFEKTAKGWIFTARKIRLDFIGDMRHHLLREVTS